jgi:hypothetical protein
MAYTTVQQLELDLAALDRLIASQANTPQQAEMIRTSLLAQYTNVGGQQLRRKSPVLILNYAG